MDTGHAAFTGLNPLCSDNLHPKPAMYIWTYEYMYIYIYIIYIYIYKYDALLLAMSVYP